MFRKQHAASNILSNCTLHPYKTKHFQHYELFIYKRFCLDKIWGHSLSICILYEWPNRVLPNQYRITRKLSIIKQMFSRIIWRLFFQKKLFYMNDVHLPALTIFLIFFTHFSKIFFWKFTNRLGIDKFVNWIYFCVQIIYTN